MTERIAFGDLRRLGLPRGEIGAATRLARRGVAPAIDDGFVRALEGGSATVVPGVVAFEPRAVVLEDGRRLRPDIVICATGYRPGLEGLVGHLKVLDDRGVPRCQDAESLPGLPGLWFLGMQPRLFGQFQAACRDSRKLARCLLRS